MTPGALTSFVPALRELDRVLGVPMPDRIRILRELEYDLGELRDRLVARGISAEEAERRALEALVPDHRSLRELGRLHTPLYGRLAGRLDDRRLRLVERTALAVATVTVLLVEALALTRVDLLGDPSRFLWPVLGLGAVLFAGMAAKAFELWIKGDHTAPERGVPAILGLSGLVLATGIVGAFIDVYVMAGALAANPGLAGSLTLRWLVRDCALLSVSILMALAGGLFWFVVTRWLTVLMGARNDLLGEESETTSQKENP